MVVAVWSASGASLRQTDDRYRAQTWETEDGLPQNFTMAVAQTTDGYLWVGTSDGLARFDGQRFVVYSAQNTPDLGSNYIRSLLAARDGSLWIGTEGAGVCRFYHGKFESFRQSTGFLNNYVRCLFQDRAGRIWVSTAAGLARLDASGWRFYGIKEGLQRATVFGIAEDSDGTLLVGQGGGGLYRLEHDKFVSIPLPEPVASCTINAIVPGLQGGLALATVGAGLVVLKDGRIQTFGTDEGLPSLLVNTALADGHGRIWVGTTNGLHWFDGQQFYPVAAENGDFTDDVYALLLDREKNFWIGSIRGLTRLNPGGFETITTAQGLSHNIVLTAMEDHLGRLWVGTNNAGLNLWDRRLLGVYNLRPNSPGETVFALAELDDGSILAGKHGPTMIVRNGVSGPYQPAPNFAALSAHAILQDRRGDVWLGCDNGLIRVSPDRTVQTLQLATDAQRRIRALYSDSNDRLWIGTDGGLLRQEKPSAAPRLLAGRDEIPETSVRTIVGEPDGTIWLGTTMGLFRWRAEHFFHYRAENGLAHDSIQQVVVDGAGCLWMSCPSGIFRVTKKELSDFADGKIPAVTSSVFGRSFGMVSSQYRGSGQPVGGKMRDGRLLFSSANGVVIVDPSLIEPNALPPPVVIEEVTLDGKSVPIENGEVRLPSPPTRELGLKFTALSLQEPAKIHFSTRLQGFDTRWSLPNTQRTIYYRSLPPGDFLFTVRATNNDGVWNEEGSTLAIHIAPRYYQTVWFKILCPLAGLGLIAGIYWLRTGHLRRQQALLMKTVDERTQHLQREIGSRVEAENELRQSEERFSKAFGASPIPIAICTRSEGRFIDANPAFLGLIRRDRQEVIGRTDRELHIWANERERTAIFAAHLPDIHSREMVVSRRDGQQRRVLVSVERIELGHTDHLVLLMHDITELLNLEAQVRHMQKIEAVGQLAAGIAHDFNNLLTIIQGHISYLRIDAKDAETQTSLEEISNAAGRAANLTRQLLTFTRRQLMQGRAVNLNDIITRIGIMLRPVVGATIRVEMELAPELPPVVADEGMIEQVLVNLAVNARDAMPSGGTFRIRTETLIVGAAYISQHPSARPGRFVQLTVSDTGSGMTEETRARIFEPFFTTKPVGRGTGLGMSVVYGIVQQHQGWIELESELGRGSTFEIFLPVTENRIQSNDSNPPLPVSTGRERILVVEDETAVRQLACSLLKRQGYDVLQASSGPEALAVWREHQGEFHLLFTDIVMPGGLTGLELAKKLRQEKPGLRVLFTTGYSKDIMGAEHTDITVLQKPYSGSELMALVRRTLDTPPRGGSNSPFTRA
jgi:PAS domain S-box-containing protein